MICKDEAQARFSTWHYAASKLAPFSTAIKVAKVKHEWCKVRGYKVQTLLLLLIQSFCIMQDPSYHMVCGFTYRGTTASHAMVSASPVDGEVANSATLTHTQKMMPVTRSRTARLPCKSPLSQHSSTSQRDAHFKRRLSDNRTARFYPTVEYSRGCFSLTSCISFMIKPNTKRNNGFAAPERTSLGLSDRP